MGDYDREPATGPSQFLRLKGKGDKIRIRILAAPLREPKIWYEGQRNKPPMKPEDVAKLTEGQWITVMRDPTYNVQEVFHFIVLDKSDNQVKIFTTTAGVYGKVREFAQNPEWGDPKAYDLTITRTEQPGKNYYEVVPSPNKNELTDAELAQVEKIDVAEKLPAARPASAAQLDDVDPQTDPEPLFNGNSNSSAEAFDGDDLGPLTPPPDL